MPTARRPPPTLAQRLQAVAAALGVPAATAASLAADCAAWDGDGLPAADSVTMPLADPCLVARLDANARALGVPADVLALLFIGIGLERCDARERGQRWASDTAGPSRRAGGRSSGRGRGTP